MIEPSSNISGHFAMLYYRELAFKVDFIHSYALEKGWHRIKPEDPVSLVDTFVDCGRAYLK